MRFNRVIHPELVLDLRGNPLERAYYRAMHSKIEWKPNMGFGYGFNINKFTKSQLDGLCITYKFRMERPPVYHVGADFLRAIQRVDRDIPVDLLPERFFAYLSFPENVVWDGSQFIQGMYVFIGLGKETSVGIDHWHEKSFWGSFHTFGTFPNEAATGRILTDIKPGRFEETTKILKTDEDSINYDMAVFRTGLNLALYINSLGPDLVKAPIDIKLPQSDRKRNREAGAFINQCTIPLNLVSWNYQKPKQYQVESTWVDTHMRWQRCGPGYSQVKLIWVAEHERHYRNLKTDPGKPDGP